MIMKIRNVAITIGYVLLVAIPVIIFIAAAMYFRTKNKKIVLHPKFEIVDIQDNQIVPTPPIRDDVVKEFGGILNKMKGMDKNEKKD